MIATIAEKTAEMIASGSRAAGIATTTTVMKLVKTGANTATGMIAITTPPFPLPFTSDPATEGQSLPYNRKILSD